MITTEQQTAYQHKIAYYLGLNYLQYEKLRDTYFKKWCYANSQVKGWNYQAMLSNDHLRNWFAERWEVYVENELRYSYDDYMDSGVMTPDDLHDTIFILVKSILRIYPKILIEEINRKSNQYENRIRQ